MNSRLLSPYLINQFSGMETETETTWIQDKAASLGMSVNALSVTVLVVLFVSLLLIRPPAAATEPFVHASLREPESFERSSDKKEEVREKDAAEGSETQSPDKVDR